jgi:hypothetical protein
VYDVYSASLKEHNAKRLMHRAQAFTAAFDLLAGLNNQEDRQQQQQRGDGGGGGGAATDRTPIVASTASSPSSSLSSSSSSLSTPPLHLLHKEEVVGVLAELRPHYQREKLEVTMARCLVLRKTIALRE